MSVVIPAFNEQEGVGPTVEGVRRALESTSASFEVIVVDDGSEDETGPRAAAQGARVVRLRGNRGYGAALRAGIDVSVGRLVAIIDADGTYPPAALPRLVARAEEADMVVGARAPGDQSIPTLRRPAKWLLTRLASYLAGQPIPDLNSGLRVVRRRTLRAFRHILPPGFSFTTTLTLALMSNGYRVVYEPVVCSPRVGVSKIRATHFTAFVILVLRTMVLFNPLKVFLPVGAGLFVVGLVKFVYDLFLWNLSETAVMAFLAAVIIWCVGLLADLIVRLDLRRPSAE